MTPTQFVEGPELDAVFGPIAHAGPYKDPYPIHDVDLASPNPWGVPNWRDADQYVKYQSLAEDDYFWEFLRRTESYRSLWEEMQKFRASQVEEVEIYHKYTDLAIERFGISSLIPPYLDFSEASPHFCRVTWDDTITHSSLDLNDWLKSVEAEGMLLVKIDLSTPFGPQLEAIARDLPWWRANFPPEEYRKPGQPEPSKRTRKRIDKYPTYLRLLDARDRKTKGWGTINVILDQLTLEDEFDALQEDGLSRLYRQAKAAQKKACRWDEGG